MRTATAFWLERLFAACLAAFFLAVVLPSIHEGGTLSQSRMVAIPVYVSIALVPLLLIVLGQRGRWALRAIGWFLLCAIVVGVVFAL